MPVISSALLILGFIFPISIPVTNDLIAKKPNCAYTFKSTSEDMSLFCKELMEKCEIYKEIALSQLSKEELKNA